MTHITGPVPLTSEFYIERAFEREAVKLLLNRQWALLLGPRQHGKTSALIRIRRSLNATGFRCAFVDLQGLPPGLNFSGMLNWFSKQVADSLGHKLVKLPEGTSDSIEDWLNCAVPMPGTPVVILIDEASAIRDEHIRNAFYGQIRAIKSAAAHANQSSLSATIQFLFSGTFRPETLVDDLNSPFNICMRVDTEDLGLKEVVKLAQLALGRQDVTKLAECIFHNVGGQPHLVQSFLAVANDHEEANELDAIDAEVARLSIQGSDHLDSIFRTVVQEPALLQIGSTAATHGKIKNDPANVHYKFMMILGLMRREGNDLYFRNMLYETMARSSTQMLPESAQKFGIASHFYMVEISAFAFIKDVEYREICHAAYNGAIASINSRNHRLALVGFGVALETILLDWLIREPPASIAGAISAAASKKRPSFIGQERVLDPSTWRLVNMMLVARLFNRVRGPIDPPEALREMRNFVHPAAMKKRYLSEEALGPEAVAAGGLLGMVMRDIQLP
jgi:hypothetical protein